MPKPKRVLKSKEELVKDLKKNQDFQEKMKFVRESLYPALCEASTSIEDAQNQLYQISTMIMQKFLEKMKEVKFKDIGLADILNKEDPQYAPMKAMLDLFDDKNVYDTKDIIEGLKNEINLFISDENKDRKLSELKTKWVDQL